MAIRDDISVDFSVSPRIVVVLSPSVGIDVVDLFETLRHIEETEEGILYKQLVSAGGKQSLGGGVQVGVTVTLRNALISFEARSGPSWVSCKISGGNLVAVDASGNPIDTPIKGTAYINVNYQASSSATAIGVDMGSIDQIKEDTTVLRANARDAGSKLNILLGR